MTGTVVRVVDDVGVFGQRELLCHAADQVIAAASVQPDGRWSVLPWPAIEQAADVRVPACTVLDEEDARSWLQFLAVLYLAVPR